MAEPGRNAIASEAAAAEPAATPATTTPAPAQATQAVVTDAAAAAQPAGASAPSPSASSPPDGVAGDSNAPGATFDADLTGTIGDAIDTSIVGSFSAMDAAIGAAWISGGLTAVGTVAAVWVAAWLAYRHAREHSRRAHRTAVEVERLRHEIDAPEQAWSLLVYLTDVDNDRAVVFRRGKDAGNQTYYTRPAQLRDCDTILLVHAQAFRVEEPSAYARDCDNSSTRIRRGKKQRQEAGGNTRYPRRQQTAAQKGRKSNGRTSAEAILASSDVRRSTATREQSRPPTGRCTQQDNVSAAYSIITAAQQCPTAPPAAAAPGPGPRCSKPTAPIAEQACIGSVR